MPFLTHHRYDEAMDLRLQQRLQNPNLRILVVVRDHMSGLLYAVPNLRELRQAYPQAHITLLGNPYGMPILNGCPYVDQMLPFFQFSRQNGRIARLKGHWQQLQAWLKLIGRVDLILHFRWVGPEMLALCKTLGRPFQIGYSQDKWDHLLDINVGREDLINESSRQRNAHILEPLGLHNIAPDLEIWVDSAETAWVRTYLAEQGWHGSEPLFVFHPGSHWGCNEWLPERWSALANGLLAKYGGQIVLTGTERERPLTTQIASKIAGSVINAAGHTTLPHFAALLNEATLVVSVDTAPTQICQALNKSAVILMGAGNVVWKGNEHHPNVIILQDDETADDENPLCQWHAGTCHTEFCSSSLANIKLRQALRAADTLLITKTQTLSPTRALHPA